jgi:hypothetical protein
MTPVSSAMPLERGRTWVIVGTSMKVCTADRTSQSHVLERRSFAAPGPRESRLREAAQSIMDIANESDQVT